MHGRVVGELGGHEPVFVMDASQWKKTPSALAATYSRKLNLRLPHVVHHHPTPSRYR